MSTTDQLLGQFIEAWNAGERPDVRDVPGARERGRPRRPRRTLLSAWLELAPTPAWDEATLEQISATPALRAALDAAATEPVSVGEQVLALRERAGLGVTEVARRLARLFEARDEPRATAYLEELERGELDPGGLSRRLLAGLAAILGADRDELTLQPAMSSGQTFFRSEGEADEWFAEGVDALSRAALSRPDSGPSTSWTCCSSARRRGGRCVRRGPPEVTAIERIASRSRFTGSLRRRIGER